MFLDHVPEINEWKKHSAKSVALNSLGFKQVSMFSCQPERPEKLWGQP